MPIQVLNATKVTNELGYTRWTWVPLIHSSILDTQISISDTEIPSNLIPASEFQVDSETSTCTFIAPWGGFADPFTEFELGGGTSGTLIGAINGLYIVEQSFLQKDTAQYGIGREYTGPEFGYCIGTLFKEKIYSVVSAQNVSNLVFVGSSYEDLIFRSKFERFYVNHGKILSFNVKNSSQKKYSITIPTGSTITSINEIDFTNLNDKIKLYKKYDGSNIDFKVIKVTGYAQSLEIDLLYEGDTKESISFGIDDFFQLSTSWLIQDPYLMDGLMNNISDEATPSGTQEFFRTDQNQIFSEGSFTGVYIRKRVISNDENENGTYEEDEITYEIDMPSQNAKIISDTNYKWFFYPISGLNSSDLYTNNDRYVIDQFSNSLTGETEYTESKMDIATDGDYEDYNEEYIRVEISFGGRSTRTNFYENSLIGSYVIQDNYYFEILGQVSSHTIDVSVLDVTLQKRFDPNSNKEYKIFNQYAWKTVEWYMSLERQKFLQGTITSISGKSVNIHVNAENVATLFGQRYFDHGERKYISFHERFTKEYDHDINSSPRKLYSKYKGWYLYNSSGDKYEIENISIPDREDYTSYDIVVKLNDSPSFAVGQVVNALFDKEPYPRIGSFNGSYIAEVTQINPGRGDVNVTICLDANWLSPRFNIEIPSGTNFGLCGAKYWGLGDRAPDNENAVVFMRTPAALFGISSLFHRRTDEDWVLFYDYISRKLAIRRGGPAFLEFPYKYEVSVGLPSSSKNVKVLNGVINLDNQQDRTKMLSMNVPDGDELLFYYIKDTDNYYGTVIGGNGETDLVGLFNTELEQNKENYKYNDSYLSPVYSYMYGKFSKVKRIDVDLTIPTSDSPIILSNDTDIHDVYVQYVKEEQTIEDASFFDIHEINDDEMMIIMGKKFGSFYVVNPDSEVKKKSNDNFSGTYWTDSNTGVYIIGSKDTGIYWGTPVKNRMEFKDDNQYGLLVLPNAVYSCSFYSEANDDIYIFFLGYSGNDIYLGNFIINARTLNYKNFKCNHDDGQDFIWRPIATSDFDLNNGKVIDNYVYNSEDCKHKDDFVIIASENANLIPSVVVDRVSDFGIISVEQLSDSSLVLFYDSLDGIKMLASNALGRLWSGNGLVLASGAKSALYINGLLCYITISGIEIKIMPESLLSTVMRIDEGNSQEEIEIIQNILDSQKRVLTKTGSIPIQKLTGYVDNQNQTRIYYYDDEKKLCSISGTDLDWSFTNNF